MSIRDVAKRILEINQITLLGAEKLTLSESKWYIRQAAWGLLKGSDITPTKMQVKILNERIVK